jgi:hypothetical protein
MADGQAALKTVFVERLPSNSMLRMALRAAAHADG